MGGVVKAEKDETTDKKDKKDKKEKKEKEAEKTNGEVKKAPSSNELETVNDQRKLFKEGQRHPTPPMADATRSFYVSLLEENPDSKNAIKFCIEFGVLSLEEHNKLLKKFYKLREKGAFSVQALMKKHLDKKMSKENKLNDKDKKDKKEKKEKKEKAEKDEKAAASEKGAAAVAAS